MGPTHPISFKSDGLNTNLNFSHLDLKIAWRQMRFNGFKEDGGIEWIDILS